MFWLISGIVGVTVILAGVILAIAAGLGGRLAKMLGIFVLAVALTVLPILSMWALLLGIDQVFG